MITLTICLGVACVLLATACWVYYREAELYADLLNTSRETVQELDNILASEQHEYETHIEQLEHQLEMALEREQDLLAVVEEERDPHPGLVELMQDDRIDWRRDSELPPRPWNIAAQRCTFDPR